MGTPPFVFMNDGTRGRCLFGVWLRSGPASVFSFSSCFLEFRDLFFPFLDSNFQSSSESEDVDIDESESLGEASYESSSLLLLRFDILRNARKTCLTIEIAFERKTALFERDYVYFRDSRV